MRVSADREDPGFTPDCIHYRVWLDGQELKRCITADDEEGLAVCYKLDATGKIETAGDEVVLETLRGKVEIIDIRENPECSQKQLPVADKAGN